MSDVRRGRRMTRLPDTVSDPYERYADILALLDRRAAVRMMVASMPRLAGVDMACVGESDGGDRMVLRYALHTETNLDGLVVPVGAGLGGRVLLIRRTLWVSDYCASPGITDQFRTLAEAEGVRGMIAVPIEHDGQLLGVLYGANRYEREFGERAAEALEKVAHRTAAAQVVAERARHAAERVMHEERRRVVLELQDSVGAMLFALQAGLQQLGDEPELDEQMRARLSEIERQTAEAASALRGSVRVLTALPEQVALDAALREHCGAFTERTGVSAKLITLTEPPALPSSRAMVLADAVREALLNVEKHAKAQSVVVSVFAHGHGVAVTVSDDGVGLGGDGACPSRGLGLAAMSERVARVGGTVTVGRSDDGGVTVQAWVPT